ncbi:hypothetical protein KSS87_012694 [Heliosperma pusillum]|nr:hypothetical protein KSS87_012694 [Heliosperma pusillum]
MPESPSRTMTLHPRSLNYSYGSFEDGGSYQQADDGGSQPSAYGSFECPQHPNGYVCGCYDMRWMYNITFHYSTGKKKDFEKLMADSSMSLDDIDDIKEVWATKCSEKM